MDFKVLVKLISGFLVWMVGIFLMNPVIQAVENISVEGAGAMNLRNTIPLAMLLFIFFAGARLIFSGYKELRGEYDDDIEDRGTRTERIRWQLYKVIDGAGKVSYIWRPITRRIRRTE